MAVPIARNTTVVNTNVRFELRCRFEERWELQEMLRSWLVYDREVWGALPLYKDVLLWWWCDLNLRSPISLVGAQEEALGIGWTSWSDAWRCLGKTSWKEQANLVLRSSDKYEEAWDLGLPHYKNFSFVMREPSLKLSHACFFIYTLYIISKSLTKSAFPPTHCGIFSPARETGMAHKCLKRETQEHPRNLWFCQSSWKL